MNPTHRLNRCHQCKIQFLDVDWIEPRTLGYCSESCAEKQIGNYMTAALAIMWLWLNLQPVEEPEPEPEPEQEKEPNNG